MKKLNHKKILLSPTIIEDKSIGEKTYEVLDKIVKYSKIDNLSNFELGLLQKFLESEGAEFPIELKQEEVDTELAEVLVAITKLNVSDYIKFVRRRITKTRENKKKRLKFRCSKCNTNFKSSKYLKDHILDNHNNKWDKVKGNAPRNRRFGTALLNSYKHVPKKNKSKERKDFTPSDDAIWFVYPGSFESKK